MNSTHGNISLSIHEYYIVCTLSVLFAILAVGFSSWVLILVQRTKSRLHTIRHLLICNTCIATIIYCIVQTNNYIFLLFLPDLISDRLCRLRGYLGYVSICGITYSYFLQSVSRFIIIMLSTKFKWLTTFKTHYILITLQWILVVIFPLPAILTNDIYYIPNNLCWVPMGKLLHVIYTCVLYYAIPTSSIGVIYAFIYYQIKQEMKGAPSLVRLVHGDKRDLEVLRNILILLCVYFVGGTPTLLFIATGERILYLIGIVTISMAVAFEKLCAILLDRELRQVTRGILTRSGRVTPSNNTFIAGRYQVNIVQFRSMV